MRKLSQRAASHWIWIACDLACDPEFWYAYEQLATPQKNAARRAFRLFLQDPGHNSLQFKKLRGHADYWSVRVSRDIRAVGKRRGDTMEWAWIGTHNEFDKLFG